MHNVISIDSYKKTVTPNKNAIETYMPSDIALELYKDFNEKWVIQERKEDWLFLWTNSLKKITLSPTSIKLAAEYCLQNEKKIPSILFFVFVCILHEGSAI